MNQIRASCNVLYYGKQRLLFISISISIQVRNDVSRIENRDNNKDYLSSTDIHARWYYFGNSNNGKIPEDELNCQTSKIDSNKTTSIMKWKI